MSYTPPVHVSSVVTLAFGATFRDWDEAAERRGAFRNGTEILLGAIMTASHNDLYFLAWVQEAFMACRNAKRQPALPCQCVFEPAALGGAA